MPRYVPDSPFQEAIVRLERQLDEARRVILDLMPEAMTDLLTSYHRCDSRDETFEWQRKVLDNVIASAQVIPAPAYIGERAYCPLCGEGPQSFVGPDGFKLPEGMDRHLTGYANMPQCGVMKAALELARKHWDEKFSEAEEAERVASEARLAERRQSETLYRTAPDSEPELLDRDRYIGRSRTVSELEWAEGRLRDLGININIESNVKSYTLDAEDFVVYADPRTLGRIDFTVFLKPLPKPSRNPRIRFYDSFYILDSWKKDLPGKFSKALTKAHQAAKESAARR